jgi:site-specific recombinase XerD
MRWDHIHGLHFISFRKKTETTRKNNKKEITVPITEKLQDLIDKIGVKDSPFILGELQDGYHDNTFENKSHKLRQKINRNLTIISEKMKLTVPLKMQTARDCYASTMKRAGKSKDIICDMLGHSNSIVTEHYLDSLISEETLSVNEVLI